MELHLKIIGCILIGLALVHSIFPFYFKWKVELEALSLINRQMMKVHTLFIAVSVLLMGALCVTASKELASTDLGHKVCFGFGLFWGLRLFIQFFGYSSKLWKGKLVKTLVHILFSMLWSYFTWVFFTISFE